MERVYLANRVRTILATDERVAATDLRVHFTDQGRGVVTGEVATEAQHRAIDEVLSQIPGAESFLNRTHVRRIHAPHEPEAIGGESARK